MTHTRGGSLLNGAWVEGGGASFVSTDPLETKCVWEGRASDAAAVDAAVAAAREAAAAWSALGPTARRQHLEDFVALVGDREDELALAISEEIGKPRWDAATEVAAVKAKLAATIRAYEQRVLPKSKSAGAAESVTFFRPIGPVAVLGPFNFPIHMPNGHIMPALLAGDTVIFKPSNLAPWVGELYASIWNDALPRGVLNLVQGGAETGSLLTTHEDVAGVFFNGSRETGVGISRSVADHPEKLLVLEMGGNNSLVIWDYDDVRGAVHLAVQSSYITAGQRCTAARHLIVREDDEDLLVELAKVVRDIRVGLPFEEPEPFMGPVVSKASAERVLRQQDDLVASGGVPLVKMEPTDTGLPVLRPGLIDVTSIGMLKDEEIFGPLLQVHRVADFAEAVRLVNSTRYGLASGIVCRERAQFEAFCARTHTGIVNWNQQLTGASGMAPFGGLGESGNHRPSGFMAVDYCSDAVGSLQSSSVTLPETLSPGLTL